MKPILIAGPTASGKSALAVALAERSGALVVNVDSMQVDRDLRVLTARPTPQDEARAEHRLFGHVDGAVNHSVAHHQADIAAVLAEARGGSRGVILVGGTGLYFKALLDGLSAVPPVPEVVRARVRAAAEGQDTPSLHAALAARDPQGAARLEPGDRLRVLRAIEVLEATGRPLHSWHGERRPGPLQGADGVRVFLAPDRATLAQCIDARFRTMIAAGALDEVAALGQRKLDPALPIMRAHGVPALLAHLAGAIGLEEAIARGQADTRAYAKRQFTWFRHQMPGWTWMTPDDPQRLMEQVAALEAAPRIGPPVGALA